MSGSVEPIKEDPKEPCAEKTYTWMVGGKAVTVTLTIDDDGVVTAKIKSEVDMDVNALYWGDDDGKGDFEGFKKKDSSLNMNGEGSQYEGEAVLWDDAQKISSPGSKDAGYIEAGGYKEFTLEMDAHTFNNLVYFGIRATSVGEDGEDSLKLVGKPEDCPPDDCTDHFPDFENDISYVNFVFKLKDGAIDSIKDLDTNGDKYVTVKIEMPKGYTATDCSNNLDSWYEDALAQIYKKYSDLDENSTLEGVLIKGGGGAMYGSVTGGQGGPVFTPDPAFDADYLYTHSGQFPDIAFFALDDDPGNDPLPEGLGGETFVGTGDNSYHDGNFVDFNPAWVPEECDCVA